MIHIPRDLDKKIKQAIQSAQQAGALPQFEVPQPEVTRAKPEHGDYATPVAMQLAKLARMKPDLIAEAIVEHFPTVDYVGSVERTGGFINIRLADSWLQQQVDRILKAGSSFAQLDNFAGKRAQVECVSANPTGPITIAHTRGGVVGDTIARLLAAVGYQVEMEYYFNNAGQQMRKLGESVRARYLQQLGQDIEFLEDWYQGDYIRDIAESLIAEKGSSLLDADYVPFKNYAEQQMFKVIQASLNRIGIKFDNFFNENSLYESGAVKKLLKTLRKAGYAYKKDGATWFKATEFGIDKDRVLVASSGDPTYRTPDIAYHIDKLERGFDLAVNILGADHAEEAKDVSTALTALGYDASRVQVVLVQFVLLKGAGKISKRKGNIETLDDLVEDVGADAVRYFMLARSANSHMEFDRDLAVKQSNENPVYYIQNAHVRCAGIAREAAERGFSMDGGDVSLLTHPRELGLVRKMLELPEIIEQAALALEPHKIAIWAHEELARTFHPTYDEIRALHSEVPEDLAKARLKLYAAAQIALARTLDLMGMGAPERM